MGQFLMDPDFALSLFDHVAYPELVLLDSFQSEKLSSPSAAHQPDHSEGSFPQQVIADRFVIVEELVRQSIWIARETDLWLLQHCSTLLPLSAHARPEVIDSMSGWHQARTAIRTST